MSVPDQGTANFYVANGITTSFPYGFYLLTDEDLFVSIDNVIQSSGYTVTGVGNKSGGTVVFSVAPADGAKVLLERHVALERTTDYQPNGDLRSDVLNTDFDRIWMVLQDKRREFVRSIRYPVFEDVDGTLPNAATRAGKVLGFADNGLHTLLPIPAAVGAGDLRYETFTAGVHFTPGVTTSLTLDRDPGTPDNLSVHFDPLFQGPNQWGVTGRVLTFTSPIPVGVTNVFVRSGTTVSVTTPPDRSVGDDELSWGTVLSRSVDTIDQLRSLPSIYYRRAFVAGYHAPGDGGGGHYFYDPSASASFDNGGTIIAALEGLGCWRLMLDGSTSVSVRQFGAKGDWNGTTGTDDSEAFQNAINWCQNNKVALYVPGGALDALVAPNFGYCAKGLVITKPITIFGEATSHNMPQINLWDGSDSQLFTIQAAGVTFRGLSLFGSATTLTPNQRLIFIQGVNEFQLEDCVLSSGYDNIYIDGTAFYLSFLNSKFGEAVNSWMRIFSAAAGGVDFFMDNCRGLAGGGMLDAGFSFSGIGSCLMTNCQFSPNSGNFTAMKVYQQAPAAGVFQFTNVVFETAGAAVPGVWLMGSVGAGACKYWKFTNCYSLGNPALRIDYGFNIIFNDGYLTGGGTACHVENHMDQLTLDNVDFQVLGNVLTLGNAATNLGIYVREPMYKGLAIFAAYDNVPLASWNWLNIEGGNIGLDPNPIRLTDQANTPGYREAKGHNLGVVKRRHITGTLAAGAGTFAHGINSASARVINLSVFAKVAPNEATPIDRFAKVDNTNVVITGSGVGNVYVRMIIEYVDSDPNW